MDIICAKCGKHLNSIEACHDHHCSKTIATLKKNKQEKISKLDTTPIPVPH